MSRYLISYVHFNRTRRRDKVFKENLEYFLNNGLIDKPNYHFNFVINSDEPGVDIPGGNNITVLKGDNTGYDFGAWKQSLLQTDIDSFDYYIFINDTCRGPFIPNYIPTNLNWVTMFCDKLTDTCKLVCPTIFQSSKNKRDWVQSFCFGTDRVGVNILMSSGVFDVKSLNKRDIIHHNEKHISNSIISRGYTIKPFQLSYGIVNKRLDDIHWPNRYYNTTLHPLEVMFIKTNRIMNQTIKNYTKWIKKEPLKE